MKWNNSFIFYNSLSYLDRYIKTALPGVHNDEWQPLISYRASLQHNEFEVPLNRQPGRQYKPKKHGRDEDGKHVGNFLLNLRKFLIIIINRRRNGRRRW